MRKMYTVRAETETNNKNAAVMLGFVGPSCSFEVFGPSASATRGYRLLPHPSPGKAVEPSCSKPAEPPSAVSLSVLPL